MSRITPLITFNLNERGRQWTGQDRSNVDVKAWVDLINSPTTQEAVDLGDMVGYYGHQIRQLFGTIPPETALLNGKEYRLNPAIRVVELKAQPNGDVSHRIEFLETDAGEHAFRQYKAKVGGFSMAIDAKPNNGMYVPELIGGFDYVLQQNYVHNCGHGQFDSALQVPAVREIMEQSLVEILDSIATSNFAYHQLEDAAERQLQAGLIEQQYLEEQERIARRKRLQDERQEQLVDSALCAPVTLEDLLGESDAFMNAEMQGQEDNRKNKSQAKIVGGFFNFL